MKNDRRARIKEEADRLSKAFVDAGALPVETDSLLPADVLLDLYGEDIRARAYVTQDPVLGERMLRPDFTVPIVQRHMAEGAEPARYTYNGAVWRKQARAEARTSEYVQVGYELFDRENPAAADAEVFALFSDMLAGENLRVATGDIGILLAAISALDTTERRRSALRRHVWRPGRFVRLLERYGENGSAPDHRVDLLVQIAVKGVDVVLEEAGDLPGLRQKQEVLDRIDVLSQDAKAKPISAEQVAMVEEILDLRGTMGEVLWRLRELSTGFPALTPSADIMEERMGALSGRGIPAETLPFEVSFGRTTLEYYDGFVFGFFAENRPDLPVVASGGRYDALTEVLGQGRSIAAVGGVIRPEALVSVRESLT